MHRYEIIVFLSNEDEAFIADVPELPDLWYGSIPRESLATRFQDPRAAG